MKLKKNAKPKGTKHTIQMLSGNQPVEATYKVLSVTDEPSHLSDAFEPFVYLRLAQKVGYPVDNFICLPLSVFAEVATPVSDADKFWEDGKSTQA